MLQSPGVLPTVAHGQLVGGLLKGDLLALAQGSGHLFLLWQAVHGANL